MYVFLLKIFILILLLQEPYYCYFFVSLHCICIDIMQVAIFHLPVRSYSCLFYIHLIQAKSFHFSCQLLLNFLYRSFQRNSFPLPYHMYHVHFYIEVIILIFHCLSPSILVNCLGQSWNPVMTLVRVFYSFKFSANFYPCMKKCHSLNHLTVMRVKIH